MAGRYVSPYLNWKGADVPRSVTFTCQNPACQTLAPQRLDQLWRHQSRYLNLGTEYGCIYATTCTVCRFGILWVIPVQLSEDGETSEDYAAAWMLHPRHSTTPHCHPEAPPQASELYKEAAEIMVYSQRAAAVLIRCALESLFRENFETDAMLGQILAKHEGNMSTQLFEEAELVKLVGNEGAHSDVRVLNLDEDVAEVIENLFEFFNSAVEELVAEPAARAARLEAMQQRVSGSVPDAGDEENEE